MTGEDRMKRVKSNSRRYFKGAPGQSAPDATQTGKSDGPGSMCASPELPHGAIAFDTDAASQLSIGVGKVALPALRTVLAVLPHTALQSLVSSTGVSRLFERCFG